VNCGVRLLLAAPPRVVARRPDQLALLLAPQRHEPGQRDLAVERARRIAREVDGLAR
jgi:hypothetical protein